MTTRRSFLARLSAFLGGAVTTVPKLVEATERKTECSTATDVDVVYVVTKAILDAQPGDHVIVRDTHSALSRDLGSLDLKVMQHSGALEWVRHIPPNHEPFQAKVDDLYVVTKPILDAEPGDHVIVRKSHSALHRYLTYLDLNAMLQSGALKWDRDLTPKCTVRAVTDRSVLRLVP